MPELQNPRWENFCKLTAMGKNRADAYSGAGFHCKTTAVASSRGSSLFGKLEIKARVNEIEKWVHEGAIEATMISREFVINEIKENMVMAKAAKPVLDRNGEETGQYKVDLGAANRGAELLGKELGMFRDRLDVHNLDNELADMTGDQLRAFVASAATEVGMRVVGGSDDDIRGFIRRNAGRVGLRVVEEGGEDPEGAADPEDGAVQAVPEASGVSQTRH